MVEKTGSSTGQYYTEPLPGKIPGKPVPDFEAESIVRRARAMVSLKDKPDTQATNLIRMAETALKNGNPVMARNFARQVVQSMLPADQGSIIQDSGQVSEPVLYREAAPGQSGQAEPLPGKKKHTEHTYQDASNDAGVSFTYPGNLTGPESFLAVPAHEYEHVRRSLREAILNGERVMAFVSYRVRYDPATGESYMAGGTTRTIRLPDIPDSGKGKKVDTYA